MSDIIIKEELVRVRSRQRIQEDDFTRDLVGRQPLFDERLQLLVEIRYLLR